MYHNLVCPVRTQFPKDEEGFLPCAPHPSHPPQPSQRRQLCHRGLSHRQRFRIRILVSLSCRKNALRCQPISLRQNRQRQQQSCKLSTKARLPQLHPIQKRWWPQQKLWWVYQILLRTPSNFLSRFEVFLFLF